MADTARNRQSGSVAERRRALTVLGDNPDGCTQAILLAHGFKSQLLAELGRGLISPQPKANRGKLDEGEVIDSEFVIAGGDAAALLDLVEEPLDQVTCPVQMGTEADGVLAVHFGGYVGPSALLVYERSDPVGIVAAIRQHHRLRAQSGQKHRTKPIVMRLTGSEAEAHG